MHTIVWIDQATYRKSLNSELGKRCANIHFVQNVKEKGLSFNSSDFREANASYT